MDNDIPAFDMNSAVESIADDLDLGGNDNDSSDGGTPSPSGLGNGSDRSDPNRGSDNADQRREGASREAAQPPVPGVNAPAPAVPGQPSPAPGPGAVASPPAAGTPTPPSRDPNEPPHTWSAGAKAKWATVDPELRAEIHKRESDMWSGLEGYKADATTGKSFKSVFQPYEDLLRANNMDPVRLTSDLARAHHTLSTGAPEAKVGYMASLVKAYRIDPAALAGMLGVETVASDPNNAPYIDPEVKSLRERMQAIESGSNQRQELQLREAQNRAQKEVEIFFADPANVYANDLTTEIAQLIRQGLAANPKEAYEKAIWLNPVTRQKEMERQAKVEADKQAEADRKKVEEAEKASSARVKARAKNGSAATTVGTWDDTMESVMKTIEKRH